VQILFVFVERDNEEVGEPVANYFGIAGQETTVMSRADFLVCDIIVFFFARNCRANSDSMVLQVLAYTGNEDAKKFFLDGEVSLDTIKVIAENYIQTL
jgi:protein disulfide-isomerase A1